MGAGAGPLALTVAMSDGCKWAKMPWFVCGFASTKLVTGTPQTLHFLSGRRFSAWLRAAQCDACRDAWNHHRVRSVKGRPGSGGVPNDRFLQRPNPQGKIALPAGYDGIGVFEQHKGQRARRVPRWADARDPLRQQPQRAQQRQAAVLALLGTPELTLHDVIHHRGRHRFIPAYQAFLRFT